MNRKEFLSRAPWLATGLPAYAQPGQQADARTWPGFANVRAAGAKGDGVSDDTDAIQRAMDAAARDGGGVVALPAGQYLVKGTLRMPANVTLEGVWRAPNNGAPLRAGSTLLATAGKGKEDGPAFLTMRSNSTLHGLTILYPEQVRANPPHAYPWTVQAENGADNVSIVNVTLVNPYQAVDLGSHMTGRHFVSGLYGHALYRGIYINKCFDVGRLENVHFWPFWDADPKSPLWVFTREKGVAFTIGKTDGQMGYNLFSIFYSKGMHFVRDLTGARRRDGTPASAPGSGVYTHAYMDITPNAIAVDEVDADSGVSFVNGMFMSGIEVGEKNRGQVKFTGCGFWANNDQAYHARLRGRGTVFFESCHFTNWDRVKKGHACIEADCERVIVNGCEFYTQRADHLKVLLGKSLKAAVITSNLMPGGALIQNQTEPGASLQIGFNAEL